MVLPVAGDDDHHRASRHVLRADGSSPGEHEQFYVRDMNIAWKADATGFVYHDESSDFSAGFELAVTNDVDATITK